jgi:hypothetical protein
MLDCPYRERRARRAHGGSVPREPDRRPAGRRPYGERRSERADGQTWSGARGGFLRIPETRHDLEAVEDSAVMLTVALERVRD